MAIEIHAYSPHPQGFGAGSYALIFDSQHYATITVERDIFAGDQLRLDSKRSNLDTELQKVRPIRAYGTKATLISHDVSAGQDYVIVTKPGGFSVDDQITISDTLHKETQIISAISGTKITIGSNFGYNYTIADGGMVSVKDRKIFDGFIKSPDYKFKSNNKKDFTAVAVSWDKELSEITIRSSDGADYSAKSIDYIFKDLCRIANNYGIQKYGIYAYDTSKLPYYDAGVFGTAVTKNFTGKSIWSAMQEMTQLLDIYETLHIGEWIIKIDALQSDNYIYIIPQMINTDQSPINTYKNFQLDAGKNLDKDNSRLLNYCEVNGKGGLRSQSYRTVEGQEATTQILIETSIPSNNFETYATNQPSARRYLRIKIENPTGSEIMGYVSIHGADDAMPSNNIDETYYLRVPANTTRYHFSNNRFFSLSVSISVKAFEIHNFSGCKITVDECTLAIAGKSINDYGTKAKYFLKTDITEQADVDSYAVQLVRMFHAPLIRYSFDVKPDWMEYLDFIGKNVKIFDELMNEDTEFFCIKQAYKFVGRSVRESLTLQRYNYDWEYSD